MDKRLVMLYWEGNKFWVCKLLEYHEIMSQGKTIKELKENLRDAYKMMVMEEVPENYKVKEIPV